MADPSTSQDRRQSSAWAIGGVAVASTILILVGVFQAFQGLAAIINDEFFVSVEDYAFELDLTAWGWIHLILGVILAVAGFLLIRGGIFASSLAITLAAISAFANFLFIPYYPLWSLLIIALNIFVIWAIVRRASDDV